MADGQVVFEIKGDSSGINQTVKQVTGNIQQESRKWDQSVDGSMDKAGKSFLNWKTVAAGAIAAIGAAVIKFGSDAIQAASDLQEVQNVVDTVFGDGASTIENWAQKAGQQFGLTEIQAKKFTSTLGAMMKSSGLAGNQIVSMSTDLAGLAADMASFYNLDFETAFEKIRSGISGETMPLKQLGINMSVANLEAFALAQGLEKTFSQMDQGEQTMLRYQYLMQATADAQGDFEKTSDGFANAQRRIESAVASIQTSVGKMVIEPFSEATSTVAGFLAKIAEEAFPKRTVVDEFNDIQLETDKKIEEINKVVEDVEILNNNLKEISGKEAGDALKEIAAGANKLATSTPRTWKSILSALEDIDGLQNIFSGSAGGNIEDLANALSNSNVDSSKAEAWKTVLGALNENADAVSKLTGKSVEETVKWLNEMSTAVNGIDAADADAWDKLLNTLLSGFTADTPEGKQFIEGLATQFLSLGSDSEDAVKGLQALGFSSEQIDEKQRDWLETCKRLVQTLPGLNGIINTETGEVKGGTDAIREYVKAWQEGQVKLAYLRMHEQKGNALESAYADLPGLQLDMLVAERRMKKRRDALQALLDKYGITKPLETWSTLNKGSAYATQLGLDDEAVEALNEATKEYKKYNDEAITATNTYKERADAYKEAKELFEEEGEMIADLADGMEDAGEAAEEWDEKTVTAATDAVNSLDGALKSLNDYIEGVRDSTEQAVNSIIKGFDKVSRAGDDLREKSTQNAKETGEAETKYASEVASLREKFGDNWMQELQKLGSESKEWKNLSDAEQEAYNTLVKLKNAQKEVNEALDQYKPQGMKANLESQKTFMENYIKDLETVQGYGLSDEFLATLADGSQESAEYLHNLAEAGPEAAKEVSDMFDEVQEQKEKFTNALADQKLAADEVYDALVQKATEAIAELNLGDEAEAAMSDTVGGLAQGIANKVPELQSAVDSIQAQLDRLNGFGFSFNIGGFNIEFLGSLFPHFKGGTDWVPRDNYPAYLDYGEAVLTAEENKIWQAFKSGNRPSLDYDTLGGVMQDSIKPGGNVYLEGRVVGQVMSDVQGNQYRALQRSGWQK